MQCVMARVKEHLQWEIERKMGSNREGRDEGLKEADWVENLPLGYTAFQKECRLTDRHLLYLVSPSLDPQSHSPAISSCSETWSSQPSASRGPASTNLGNCRQKILRHKTCACTQPVRTPTRLCSPSTAQDCKYLHGISIVFGVVRYQERV